MHDAMSLKRYGRLAKVLTFNFSFFHCNCPFNQAIIQLSTSALEMKYSLYSLYMFSAGTPEGYFTI